MAGAGVNSHILTLSQHTIDAYHVEMAKTVDPLLPAKRIHPTSVHSPKYPSSPSFFHHPLRFQIPRIPSLFFPLSHFCPQLSYPSSTYLEVALIRSEKIYSCFDAKQKPYLYISASTNGTIPFIVDRIKLAPSLISINFLCVIFME